MVIFSFFDKDHDTVKNSDSNFDDTYIYENLIMDEMEQIMIMLL